MRHTKVLGVVESEGVVPGAAFLFLFLVDRVSNRLATSEWDGGFAGVSLIFDVLGVSFDLKARALWLTFSVVKTPRIIPRGVASSISSIALKCFYYMISAVSPLQAWHFKRFLSTYATYGVKLFKFWKLLIPLLEVIENLKPEESWIALKDVCFSDWSIYAIFVCSWRLSGPCASRETSLSLVTKPHAKSFCPCASRDFTFSLNLAN